MTTKEEKIKFLVFSAAFPFRGGISDSTHSLCNELIMSGIKTEVWTFSLLYPSFLFPGKSQYSNEHFEQNFKVRRLINTINPFNWIKVSKMANNVLPYSIILRYWSPILIFPYFFIRLFLDKRISIIGLIDNWDNHEKILFEKLIRRLFLYTCDRFITMSDNVGKQVRQSTNKKVITLFHPINSKLPQIKDKISAKINLGLDDVTYISFVGLIRRYKGLETLVKSMKFIENKNIKLIIAGEFYEPLEKYLRIIKNLGLDNKIIIRNEFLDSKMIRDFICASDLIIQPYIKASQSGITPLCYFYETPSVVSNIDGLKEIILKDKSGTTFEKTPKNLSTSILESLNKQKNNNYIINIKRSKNKYTWLSFVEELQKL